MLRLIGHSIYESLFNWNLNSILIEEKFQLQHRIFTIYIESSQTHKLENNTAL